MMDGTIDITSEKGKGTTIKIDFELELQKSEAEARDKAPKYTAPAKPLLNEKILVVEDHDLNSEIVAEILGERGYRVVAAINGKDAVDLVRSSRPGEIYAILMDIQMPIMDGYEATRAIRGLDDSRLARIPIIAMTANAFNEDRKRAMNAGMNAYITKPIDVPQLFETLENI
jgi:CheY-like chemotaxis protein